MAWYDGTYSCGHTGRTNIVGPTKNRQWIADRHFEKFCPECSEAKKVEERNKANAEAAQKAKEMELPGLNGTEAQITWATTLRQSMIDKVEKKCEAMVSQLQGDVKLESMLQQINAVQQFILLNKTKASWYIDNRFIAVEIVFSNARDEMNTLKKVVSQPEETEAIDEATVYPQLAKSSRAVEIRISDEGITVVSEKHDEIIGIVKKLGYAWAEGVWKRAIPETAGDPCDRAAELGNKLLNSGFPVRIMDNFAREKAIEGTYNPECKRWIYRRGKGVYEGWFAIEWTDRSDLYSNARKIPGAKWDKPYVVVRPEYYREVLDFAEIYGFKFTKAANRLLDTAKAKREAAQIVVPATVVEPPPKDGLKDILNAGCEVIDDLKD